MIELGLAVAGFYFYAASKARRRGMTVYEWLDWHRLVDNQHTD